MATETLRTYTATWLETIRPTVRHTTVRAYEQTLRVRALPYLGDTPVDEITRPQLKAWFALLLGSGRYKAGTAAHAVVTLHTVLAAAVEDQMIQTNPAASLRRALRGLLREKKASHRPSMSPAQLRAFLKAARENHERFPGLLLLALTGVRLGEAVGVQWDDVDFEASTILIERQVYADGQVGKLKTGAGLRKVPMPKELADVLRKVRDTRMLDESRFQVPGTAWVLFPDLGQGTTAHMARDGLNDAVKAACRKAGLPKHYSCHTLRHTLATNLLAMGAPLKFVQQLLGHASIVITADRYGWSAKMTDGGTMETFAQAALTGGEKDA